MEAIWLIFEGLDPWAKGVVEVLALLLLAWLLGQLVQALARRLPQRGAPWRHPAVLAGMARVVPSVLVQFGVYSLQHVPPTPTLILRNMATVVMIFYLMRAVVALLDALNESYRSLTSYVQLGRLIAYIVGSLLIVATLLNRSPLLLLSGLGAMSAVLMLVFKDTILSFVAGVQLASNDMLRVGDWIEMPQENADGAVLDIGLNTVKVQNWDKTITTIPTWKLMSESFKNWRGMFDAGGRRIKRALHLDAATIAIMGPELRQKLAQQQPLLADFLQDPAQANATNMAAFMAYAQAHLEAHPSINKAEGMFLMVRLLDPTALGVPVEIYSYTADTAWVKHEAAQGALFDHLIGILPQFGLALYQRSSDYSIRPKVPLI